MEVRDEGVHGAEAEAGDDDEGGLALARRGPALRVERRLEGARRGGADGDDAAALRPRAGDRGGRGLGDGEGLGVDAVLATSVRLDRPERPGPDVEDELGALDAALAQARRGGRR